MFNFFSFNNSQFNADGNNTRTVVILIPIFGSVESTNVITGGSPGSKKRVKRTYYKRNYLRYNIDGVKRTSNSVSLDVIGKVSDTQKKNLFITGRVISKSYLSMSMKAKVRKYSRSDLKFKGISKSSKSLDYNLKASRSISEKTIYEVSGIKKDKKEQNLNISSITRNNRLLEYDLSSKLIRNNNQKIEVSGKRDILGILEVLDLI